MAVSFMPLKGRNTSTDVEKTRASSATSDRAWKHLHGRGEDFTRKQRCGHTRETPPRTWRRLRKPILQKQPSRNTSTDVEKTEWLKQSIGVSEKHLHGRGEDCCDPSDARRAKGNTSTDVEKTAR